MNKHMWKKLGEVKAFAEACITLLETGQDGFIADDIFSAEEIDNFIQQNKGHLKQIEEISADAGETETVDNKAAATGEKLADMQGRYLSDEEDWQDGMELLEWSGFFFGGAVVHWKLIEGASEIVHEADLTALVGNGTTFHAEMLDVVTKSIHDLAKAEAQE